MADEYAYYKSNTSSELHEDINRRLETASTSTISKDLVAVTKSKFILKIQQ